MTRTTWRRWIPLTALACMVAAGCTGTKKGETRNELPPRASNTELLLLTFGALQGELLECG